ncbi:MAG: hypothetical protein NZ922_06325 [Candidatus Methanomethyliaceae archaeon]|nr:hypothetical protein [Candidatus Methanomethyliaceae archaeon]MDW7971295.1 FlaD/FlaE family flagellar protein [Nitrososphaerota archaeon]
MEVLTTALTNEDFSIKMIQIEDRISKLESALSEISGNTTAVLSDIRTVLTELENPMNYLKGLGIDEVVLTMTENVMEKKLKEFLEKRLDVLVRSFVENKLKEIVEPIIMKCLQEQAHIMIEEKIKEMKDKGILKVPIDTNELKNALDEKLKEFINSEKLNSMLKEIIGNIISGERLFGDQLFKEIPKQLNDLKNSSSNTGSIVGLTACASILIQMFGKSGAEKIVEECYRIGWLSDEVKSSLLRVLSVINSENISESKDPNIRDYIVAMFLFDKLTKGASDLDFIMVLKLLKPGV